MKKKFRDLFENEEIPINDLLGYFFQVVKRSKYGISFIFVFLLIVLSVHYSFAPRLYLTKATVIHESESSNNNLSAVSTMLGVGNPGVTSNSSVFDVEMYDEIVTSESFLYSLACLEIPKSINSKDSIYIGDMILSYIDSQNNIIDKLTYKKDFKKTEWKSLKSITSYNPDRDLFIEQTPNLVKYDPLVLAVLENMKSIISIEKKEKFITVSAKMNSPYYSAILSKVVLENLVFLLKKFKVQRQLNQIQYLELKVNEAKRNYSLTQRKLASNKDKSLGLIFESSNISDQNLTNDNTIAFNIYNQSALQLEQSKSNLKIETPVFTTLDQIKLPNDPFSPNIYKLLIYYLAAGSIISILYVFVKLLFNY